MNVSDLTDVVYNSLTINLNSADSLLVPDTVLSLPCKRNILCCLYRMLKIVHICLSISLNSLLLKQGNTHVHVDVKTKKGQRKIVL